MHAAELVQRWDSWRCQADRWTNMILTLDMLHRRPLYAWPPHWTHAPPILFCSETKGAFLHPAIVEKLGVHFMQPEVGEVLRVKTWDKPTAGKQIQELLPREWKIEQWAAGRDQGGTVLWLDGRRVWQKLLSVWPDCFWCVACSRSSVWERGPVMSCWLESIRISF